MATVVMEYKYSLSPSCVKFMMISFDVKLINFIMFVRTERLAHAVQFVVQLTVEFVVPRGPVATPVWNSSRGSTYFIWAIRLWKLRTSNFRSYIVS